MTNDEFRTLFILRKKFVKDPVILPLENENSILDVKSTVSDDKFFLDIDRRGRIEFSKCKIQERYSKGVI